MTQNEWNVYASLKPFDVDGKPIKMKVLRGRYVAWYANMRKVSLCQLSRELDLSRHTIKSYINKYKDTLVGV